jgi:hypothetical protein
MLQQLHGAKICGIDLLYRRMVHIGLDPSRLKPDQLDILGDIRERCPTCEDPARCAADLTRAAPEPGWEDWDEYCPNAARLRILAALAMFPDDVAEAKNDVCHAARIADSDDRRAA